MPKNIEKITLEIPRFRYAREEGARSLTVESAEGYQSGRNRIYLFLDTLTYKHFDLIVREPKDVRRNNKRLKGRWGYQKHHEIQVNIKGKSWVRDGEQLDHCYHVGANYGFDESHLTAAYSITSDGSKFSLVRSWFLLQGLSTELLKLGLVHPMIKKRLETIVAIPYQAVAEQLASPPSVLIKP